MTTQKKNSRLSARAILCQVLGMLMALTVALPSAAGDARTVYAEAVDSVVSIHVDRPRADAFGSGVVVGKNVVVTNCHVIEGHTAIQVKQSADAESQDGFLMDAVDVFGDEEGDVCLLFVEELSVSPAPPVVKLGAARALEIGEKVYAIGAPKEYELSLTGGIVSQLWYRQFDAGITAPEIQTDADILGGSSGGGLFNEDGELVGITTATDVGRIDRTELTFAMPVELVAELLARGSLEVKDGRVAAALAAALRHHAGVGNVQAQFDLGWFYHNIDADNKIARYQLTDGERWLVDSSPDLFNRLANMKAAEWYTHAAEQGHVNAQYNLADMYDRGVGVDESGDKIAAAHWFEQVVNAEHYELSPFAARHLGWYHENGQVEIEHGEDATPEEKAAAAEEYTDYLFDTAARGFLALAENGELDSEGQYYLAELHKEGKGVEQSDREAYIWFFISAENGDEDAAKEVAEMREEYDADDLRDAEADAKKRMEEMNSEE